MKRRIDKLPKKKTQTFHILSILAQNLLLPKNAQNINLTSILARHQLFRSMGVSTATITPPIGGCL